MHRAGSQQRTSEGHMSCPSLLRFERAFSAQDIMARCEPPLPSPGPMSPKKRLPDEIQDSEWLVLNCLWELRSANPFEITDRLRTRFHRVDTPKNVGIMLGRMVEKGYLRSVPGPNSPGP